MQEPSSTKESRTIVENEGVEAKVKVKQGIECQNEDNSTAVDNNKRSDFAYGLTNSVAFSRLCNQGLYQFIDNAASGVSAKSFNEFATLPHNVRNNGIAKHDRYLPTISRNDTFYGNKFDPQFSASAYDLRPHVQQSLYLGQNYSRGNNKRHRKWHDDLFRSLHQPTPVRLPSLNVKYLFNF